jgi:hypothetical protein
LKRLIAVLMFLLPAPAFGQIALNAATDGGNNGGSTKPLLMNGRFYFPRAWKTVKLLLLRVPGQQSASLIRDLTYLGFGIVAVP